MSSREETVVIITTIMAVIYFIVVLVAVCPVFEYDVINMPIQPMIALRIGQVVCTFFVWAGLVFITYAVFDRAIYLAEKYF
jgi:uncharacterized membrane protein